MKIVIKKKVSLEFLGEEYKESYLTFSAMPIKEYEEILPKIEALGEDGKKSLDFIKNILSEHFLEGKFLNEEVLKEDLEQFDIETLTRCFEGFTGQSPKAEPQ